MDHNAQKTLAWAHNNATEWKGQLRKETDMPTLRLMATLAYTLRDFSASNLPVVVSLTLTLNLGCETISQDRSECGKRFRPIDQPACGCDIGVPCHGPISFSVHCVHQTHRCTPASPLRFPSSTYPQRPLHCPLLLHSLPLPYPLLHHPPCPLLLHTSLHNSYDDLSPSCPLSFVSSLL